MSDFLSSSGRILKILHNQEEIARQSKLSQQMVSYILRGDRTPSIETAIKLEKATGICREGWLWPDRHWNPYMPFADATSCFMCHNRVGRLKFQTESCLKIFKKATNKRGAFKDICMVSVVLHGFPDDLRLSYREVTPEGLLLLGGVGDVGGLTMKMLSKKQAPMTYKYSVEGGQLTVPHYPYGMPKDLLAEFKILYNDAQLASVVATSTGHLTQIMISRTAPFHFTKKSGKVAMAYLEEIDEIWQEWKREQSKKKLKSGGS